MYQLYYFIELNIYLHPLIYHMIFQLICSYSLANAHQNTLSMNERNWDSTIFDAHVHTLNDWFVGGVEKPSAFYCSSTLACFENDWTLKSSRIHSHITKSTTIVFTNAFILGGFFFSFQIELSLFNQTLEVSAMAFLYCVLYFPVFNKSSTRLASKECRTKIVYTHFCWCLYTFQVIFLFISHFSFCFAFLLYS